MCEDCKRHGVTRAAEQVDHIVPLKDRPDLAFEPSNLQALCVPCHARKSAKERSE